MLDEILKKDNSSHSSLSESLSRTCDSIPENMEKHNSIRNIYMTEKKITGYGTWLGCTRQGLFSTLTNFREDPKSLIPNAISRGYLVRDFLLLKSLYYKSKNIEESHTTKNKTPSTSSYKKIRMHHPTHQVPEKVLKKFEEEERQYALEDELEKKENGDTIDIEAELADDQIDFPFEYMKYVNKNKDKYNGFNLIVGDVSLPEPSVWYIGNKDYSTTEKLKKNTVYGMSNGSLNTYWKKIERGKKLFKRAVESHTDLNDLVHKLLDVLSDKKDVPMNKLPKTAFEPKLEKCCAPICIEKERFNGTIFENDYATRTHTVIIIDNNDRVTMVEQDQYDTISNNYVMKQQCYVLPPTDNINYMGTSAPTDSISYGYSGRSMAMPINIPRHRKNSYGGSIGSSFQRSYTTPFTSEIPYYFSPIKNNHHSFDNLYLNYKNPISTTPMSLSSIENITGDVVAASSYSSNSSTRNNYLFNTIIPSSPSPSTSFPNLMSDLHYHSNHALDSSSSNRISIHRESDYENYDDDDNDNNNENDYLEDEMEKMSISSNSPSKIDTYTNAFNTMEKIPTLSSCTPISPSVFNFFESINSNDYKDKPLENQYVKRNVHDFSKANIHQFKLKV